VSVLGFYQTGRLAEVAFAHNVVPVENGARFVAADLHCNGFGNASPHHVANSTPSQVMEQQTNVPRLVVFPSLGAGRTFAVASQCGSGAAFRAYHPPETAGAAESLPVIAEDSYRLTIRPRENKIIRTLASATCWEEHEDIIRHHNHSPLIVLGRSGVESYCSVDEVNLPNPKIQEFVFAETKRVRGGKQRSEP